MTTTPLLEASRLTCIRSGARIFGPLDFTLHEKEMVQVCGPSGSGKTSLLLTLSRMLPFDGSLALAGKPAASIPPPAYRARVAALLSPPVNLAETIREEIRVPYALRARQNTPPPTDETIGRELEGLGLAEFAPDTPMTKLSQGQAARVTLLRTLLADPKVVLADEPAANLDAGGAELVFARLACFADDGGGVILATHTPIKGFAVRELLLDNGKGAA